MSPETRDTTEEKLKENIRYAEFELDFARRNLAEAIKRFSDARTRLRDLETAWRTGDFSK